jgi:class 3 adenylate cyclase/ActR/RegA family two-component response regulator/HAMP domain-containing protein
MTPKVLIVQTQSQTAQFLSRFFEERGDEVTVVLDLGAAATKLAQSKPDLMVLDLHFPGNEWQTFLRLVRVEYPELRIVITSKYPDVDRELKAQEMGLKAFVRQPFTLFSLNRALDTVGLPVKREAVPESQPVVADPGVKPARSRIPVSLKITFPLLLVALFFALASAFVISQLVIQSAQTRFSERLAETRIQAADAMVREEESLLRPLRLIVNVEGIAEVVTNGEAERLRELISPLINPVEEESVEILNLDGVSILSAMRTGNGSQYQFTRGRDIYQNEALVINTLTANFDEVGDKFVGVIEVHGTRYFYVTSAIYNEEGQVIGAALVGRSLGMLIERLQQDTMSQITIYDERGRPVSTTLFSERESYPLALSQVQDLLGEEAVAGIVRDLQISNTRYSEVVAPWVARGDLNLGLMSIAIPQDFLIRSGELARFEIFGLVAVGLLLVILVGLYLAGLISAPMRKLAQASNQVAQGNLDVKLDVQGSEEAAAMAHTFNYMVTGLQEGIIYRDLLGQTASPLLREQLRETFSSGNLRLDGQEVVTTVLTSAVRGFTQMAEETGDPIKIFEWLNEYFSQLAPIVTANAGVVNKFDGDVMVSFFGILPKILTPKDSAMAACEAAIEMLSAIEQLNTRRTERGDPPMITSIGINTGKVIAGGLGSGDRLHFTIMGEAVNITRHLEMLTRDVSRTNGILISQATFAALNECSTQFHLEPIGLHPVKGNTEKILVYRLLSPVSPETKVKL